ncbi:MAG: hypothetical protein AAF335_01005 [Bacteroidota bacterium]
MLYNRITGKGLCLGLWCILGWEVRGFAASRYAHKLSINKTLDKKEEIRGKKIRLIKLSGSLFMIMGTFYCISSIGKIISEKGQEPNLLPREPPSLPKEDPLISKTTPLLPKVTREIEDLKEEKIKLAPKPSKKKEKKRGPHQVTVCCAGRYAMFEDAGAYAKYVEKKEKDQIE